jgi:hypothetical protein
MKVSKKQFPSLEITYFAVPNSIPDIIVPYYNAIKVQLNCRDNKKIIEAIWKTNPKCCNCLNEKMCDFCKRQKMLIKELKLNIQVKTNDNRR